MIKLSGVKSLKRTVIKSYLDKNSFKMAKQS